MCGMPQSSDGYGNGFRLHPEVKIHLIYGESDIRWRIPEKVLIKFISTIRLDEIGCSVNKPRVYQRVLRASVPE